MQRVLRGRCRPYTERAVDPSIPSAFVSDASKRLGIPEEPWTRGKIVGVAKSFTWAGSPLFVVRTASISTVDRRPHGVHPDRPLRDRVVVDLLALVPQSDNLFMSPAS
jgi:hypothetical protein